ncbi:MAG: hypothetical protein M1587_12275, partial [Thaumarchaeota archaeon]|nr:hypothetical protein [Nitrososphaerota archaeon]
SKKFGEAKEKYSALWENSHDVWDGTGLLDCLRKLGEFDKAIPSLTNCCHSVATITGVEMRLFGLISQVSF